MSTLRERAEQVLALMAPLSINHGAPPVIRDLLAALDAAESALLADGERLRAAEQRVYGDDRTFGCDAADHLAEQILTLRAHLRAAGYLVADRPHVQITGDAVPSGWQDIARVREQIAQLPEASMTDHHTTLTIGGMVYKRDVLAILDAPPPVSGKE